jgi:hypothetical protein
MAKIHVPQLQVDDVAQSILLAWERQCAYQQEEGDRPHPDQPKGSEFLRLRLFPMEQELLSRKDRYALEDFMRFHEGDFVRNAYRGILGREPDPQGYHHYLTQLREGKMTKAEILGRLRYSPEGKAKSVKITRLIGAFLLESAFRVPVIGYLLQRLAAIFQCPSLLRKFQTFETDTEAQFKLMRQFLNQEISAIQEKINELISHRNSLATLKPPRVGCEKPDNLISPQAGGDDCDH